MTHDPLCRSKHDPDPKCQSCHLIDLGRQAGYAAALRDAVKAVYSVPRIGWPYSRETDTYDECVTVDATVAAIQALTIAMAPTSVAPTSVLADPRLSRDARLLYAVLDGRQGAAANVQVAISVLAADLGASEKSIRRWLNELRAVGLLTTRQTGRSLILAVVNASNGE